MAHKTTQKKKTTQKEYVTFNAKQVTKRLLSVLSDRARDVLVKRYGLGNDTKKMTLEAIGQGYDITRERVRQIENYALNSIRKSETYDKEHKAFSELQEEMLFHGALVSEEQFLRHLSKDESVQNHFHFLLVLGHTFVKHKENEHFAHRWHVDHKHAETVEDALKALYESLSDDELFSEAQIIDALLEQVKDLAEQYRTEEMARRWLAISKKIDKNPLGEWGRAESPAVNPKGIRDYAALAIAQHGSPLHFSEVADRIEELFGKKAHTATAHNELIKDPRFVLVGRGLYALTEWGYKEGVVSDVIKAVLEEYGPMKREEIIDKVLKERYVKANTVMVNLQNDELFRKRKDGTYELV